MHKKVDLVFMFWIEERNKRWFYDYFMAVCLLQSNLDRYAESGEQFEAFKYITKLTLDIILRCAFSYHTDCQTETR